MGQLRLCWMPSVELIRDVLSVLEFIGIRIVPFVVSIDLSPFDFILKPSTVAARVQYIIYLPLVTSQLNWLWRWLMLAWERIIRVWLQ